MDDEASAPGAARAGAAFASRRQELGITQRELAKKGIITASSLIAFEKGRSWPRERTRATLEQIVRWPAGTLATIKAGGPTPGASEPPSARQTDAPLIAEAVDVATTTIDVAIARLPGDDHPRFAAHVRAVLTDLRRLEAITVRAIRGSAAAPAVFRSLGEVRRRYDDLMTRAAAAPGATLGQRLYVTRRDAHLTAAEVALALGAPTELVTAVESESPPAQGAQERINALIEELGGPLASTSRAQPVDEFGG
jgi:transcriptional regulator with XRE-family HTH domain